MLRVAKLSALNILRKKHPLLSLGTQKGQWQQHWRMAGSFPLLVSGLVSMSDYQEEKTSGEREHRGFTQGENHISASKIERPTQTWWKGSEGGSRALEEQSLERWDHLGAEWRRTGAAEDPKHTSSSVKSDGGCVMAWACCCLPMARQKTEVTVTVKWSKDWLDCVSQYREKRSQHILRRQPRSF